MLDQHFLTILRRNSSSLFNRMTVSSGYTLQGGLVLTYIQT